MTGLRTADPPRLLGPTAPGDPPEDLATHLHRYGSRPTAVGPAGAALIRTLETIALTGHGGAHFPAATKWRTIRATNRPATVIANAAEGEPASAKDHTLLTHRPHLVLDGLLLAAETLDADQLIIWTHHNDHTTHRILHRALHERAHADRPEPPIHLSTAPDGYLSGESSAIIQALSGGPVLPRYTNTPAAIHGVHGRPTLVQNVETLARIALAARAGTTSHRPSTLLTVHVDGTPRVLEMSTRHTIADAILAAGWPPTLGRPVAVLLGGYGGTWLPWAQAATLPLHEPTLRRAGISLGAGILIPIPAGTCALAEIATITTYLADNTAGQCGPCLHGLPAIARTIRALADGHASDRDLHRMATHMRQVPGRGACHHPDGAIRFITTALDAFHDEVTAHLRGHACTRRNHPPLLPLTRPAR